VTKPIDWGAIPKEFLLFLDRMVDHGFVIEDFGGETGTLVLSSSGVIPWPGADDDDTLDIHETVSIQLAPPFTMAHSVRDSVFDDQTTAEEKVWHTPALTNFDALIADRDGLLKRLFSSPLTDTWNEE